MNDADYGRGCQLTYEVVRDWKGPRPEFVFPPKEIALIGDLRDIGERLARNDAAHELVRTCITVCLAATGRAPTAMMLLVVLDELRIPICRVSLTELGLTVGTS